MAENAQTVETTVETTDYKALYEQTLARAEAAEADRDKQKKQKDNYATENADYKRQEVERKKKELDSLPEVERLTKELEAERNARQEADKRFAEMEHKQSGLENGFTADEVAKLVGTNVDFKILKEIVSARVEEAVKSAKAESTKNSTAETLLGNGTANKGEAKSDFQKHQESKQSQSTKVEL
jgi:hypothetical protein